MILKVKRLFEGHRVLERQYNSAGWDLFPTSSGAIEPDSAHVVCCGFATEFDPGYVGLIFDRGSIGLKGCFRLAGVIDSDFRGEWKVIIANLGVRVEDIYLPRIYTFSDTVFHYSFDKAIAQVIFVPIASVNMEIVDELDLTIRGSKMGGSSDGMIRPGNVIEVGIGVVSKNKEKYIS